MPGVFISYRRQDSAGHAGRLSDQLQARLGRTCVFMDVDGIPAGQDFVEAIERSVGSCDALIAVIGPEWLGSADAEGHRRLDDPADFIRLEISAALRRNVRVIPVLVGGAAMPTKEALPAEIELLGRRQAVELRDSRWSADTADLIVTLQQVLGARKGAARKPTVVLASAFAAAIVIGLQVAWFGGADEPRSVAPAAVPVATEHSLNYSLTVRRNPKQNPASLPERVAGNTIVAAGDLVRFAFSSPQTGFLYVINEGPPDTEGRTAFNLLFPSTTSNNGSAKLAGDQEVTIPGTGEGFVFDAEAGTEKLWLVWSANSVSELQSLERWATPQYRGEIKDPEAVSELRAFLARHLLPAPEVQHLDDGTRTTLKAQGDTFVKLVTLEHR